MKYMPKIEYKYRMKQWLIILITLVLAILTVIFFQIAMVNDEGVILLEVITLDVKNATIFYYAFAALILFIALRAFQLLIISFGVDRFVILGQTAITAPKVPNSKTLLTVDYADIVKSELIVINHQTHLFIKTPNTRLYIQRAGFKNKQEFENFYNEFFTRLEQVQSE